MKLPVQVTVNKKPYNIQVDTRMILADMIRDELRLTGTHIGCSTGSCGACTVMFNGRTVKSCCILAVDADGQEITTIEALSTSAQQLHPIQEAFVENQGLQCGYCTPGMVLSTLQLLTDNPNPSEEQIRHGIAGNLCRCTGYQFIVKSIQEAAKTLPAKNAA
ncbi:MAG TPA: (2Fe-2S)-binding protein [Candidatus Binataceae bacterium]|jgi:aerobic-type carbon monoxide dehydrogenase small subunit (CoxS/CutS family)|nr:(2Fe-2S)-binding protein [Candidatus Binataceae bacterium]